MRDVPGLFIGHILDYLPTLAEKSVNCVVTSPPYFNLRDYGVPPQAWPAVSYAPLAGLSCLVEVPAATVCLGLEPTVDAYVGHLVAVFRGLRRVLADDGVCWLNLGDGFGTGRSGASPASTLQKVMPEHLKKVVLYETPDLSVSRFVPPGNLLGIPWRVALALQADGWLLRSEVIWHKQNPMPESVRNRPTKAHEQVFLLAKREGYWYDADAVRERATSPASQTGRWNGNRDMGLPGNRTRFQKPNLGGSIDGVRNARTVWTFPTAPFGGSHFAPFPPELARRCILSGCPPGGTVLDPFFGTGTTALEAEKLGRKWLGCDLDPGAVEHVYRRAFTVQKRGEA